MREIQGSDFRGFIYPNLNDFINDMSIPNPMRNDDLSDTGDLGFTGSRNYSEAVSLAQHGYELNKIDIELKSVRRTENQCAMTIEMAVAGSVVEMGAFMAGIPENMMEFPIIESAKFIHLIVDTGEICGVSSNVFINRSIVVSQLVDKLENEGYRVKVDVFYSNEGLNRGKQCVLVNVKNYQEQLSIGQIAGCLHPSFFRRLIFRHMENYYINVPYGYGRPCGNMNEIKKQLKETCAGDEIVFFPNTRIDNNFNLNDINSAKRWAEKYASNIIKL